MEQQHNIHDCSLGGQALLTILIDLILRNQFPPRRKHATVHQKDQFTAYGWIKLLFTVRIKLKYEIDVGGT
jgi:hypothetical protein